MSNIVECLMKIVSYMIIQLSGITLNQNTVRAMVCGKTGNITLEVRDNMSGGTVGVAAKGIPLRILDKRHQSNTE